jgi:hypothetical protein
MVEQQRIFYIANQFGDFASHFAVGYGRACDGIRHSRDPLVELSSQLLFMPGVN